MPHMINRNWRARTVAATILWLVARPAAAQVAPTRVPAMPDSAQMVAAMTNSMRMLKPAQFLLDHKDDLALTPEQVPFLEALVVAVADSAPVRQERLRVLMKAAEAKRGNGAPTTMGWMTWSGTLDEQAIRDGACEQSVMQAETLINITRDRHAAGAVLTPSQLARLPRLETEGMMKGMRVPGARPAKGGVYFEFQVEKQVRQVPGTGALKYPDVLRAANTQGEVLAQFVVDTAGHYEPDSFKVLKSSHQLFTQAVKDALPMMLFRPAEVGGEKVRQLVQQPFTFSLSGGE